MSQLVSWVIHDVFEQRGVPSHVPQLPKTDQNLKGLPIDAEGQLPTNLAPRSYALAATDRLATRSSAGSNVAHWWGRLRIPFRTTCPGALWSMARAGRETHQWLGKWP